MRIHPITGIALEDGFGALADDLQARRNHIPYIRQTQGDAVADAMLAKLDEADKPAAPAVEVKPEPEPAKPAEPDPAKAPEVKPEAAPQPAKDAANADAGK